MSKFLYRELRSIVLGEKIGEGFARKVYESRGNELHVIKIELRAGSFQNVSEWETWSWVVDGPLARWFAPCFHISKCGTMLVQAKVEPIRVAERPRKLPEFLCDLKRENFGMLGGRIVCCDYGTLHSVIKRAPRRMRIAEWRS